jgi:hypothetical protein
MNEMIENCFSLDSDSETKIEEKCKQVQNILNRVPLMTGLPTMTLGLTVIRSSNS